MKTKFNSVESNNLNTINNKSHSKKKKTREKKYWSEREEKTLFILQMALGTKFSIIKTFLKGKEVNDIKNHFYSKLRTYLSIQISKLKSENFFQNINQESYDIKKVLSLVLTNKIPTMILNKSIIKELILNEEEKKKLKKNENLNLNLSKENDNIDENNDESNLHKKRGRPRINQKKNENTKGAKTHKKKKNLSKTKEKNLIDDDDIDKNEKNEKNNNGGKVLETKINKKNKVINEKNNITLELDKSEEFNDLEN